MKFSHFLSIVTICRVTFATVTPYCPENITKLEKVSKIQVTPTHFPGEQSVTRRLVNKCSVGYRMDPFGSCVPQCESARCGEFEECIGPNQCRCKPGYLAPIDLLRDINGKRTCAPVCAQDCGPNAHCQDKNLCQCNINATCAIHCHPEMLWDALTLECVERQVVNITEVLNEEDDGVLVQQSVGRKLTETITIVEDENPKDVEVTFTNRTVNFITAYSIPKNVGLDSWLNVFICLVLMISIITISSVAIHFCKLSDRQNTIGSNIYPGNNPEYTQILVY